VPSGELTRAATNARLIIAIGDPGRSRPFTAAAPRAALLVWHTNGQAGDWYVERPASSPFAAAFAGVRWDSLPPATAVTIRQPDSSRDATVALDARLARRGAARPILTLEQRASGQHVATVTAAGLWRWAFRGGAAEEAYRSVVAALVDWLLGDRGGGSRARAVPVALEAQNGLPLVWRWASSDPARALRFDPSGRAALLLPPGVYRYALGGGSEQGIVAVETYSDEWLPRAPAITAQPGEATARRASVGLRDRWWLFVLAIVALAAEWTLRRRQGLP
jgi:hypothetical protein